MPHYWTGKFSSGQAKFSRVQTNLAVCSSGEYIEILAENVR